MSRKWRQSTINIDIDVSDILCELNDDTIKEEYAERFGKAPLPTAASFDMLDELHWFLRNGQVQHAIAMIESAQNARLISEEARQKQFQMEGRVQ